MRPSTETSRNAILDAAEELMAERGVDAVSLRDINHASGQRNASGVQYHFGNRDGLLVALVARHMTEIDQERNAMLDEIDNRAPAPLAAGGTSEATALVTALVVPLAARLASPSGRRYLRIAHQLLDRPVPEDTTSAEVTTLNRSLRRVSRRMAAATTDLPPRIRVERSSQVTNFMLRSLADQARRHDTAKNRKAPMSDALFTANLIDVLVGVLTAPASAEARRLARR